ncbi:MAG: polysaccharide pyruvyl transferase family protein [Cyclobacteriaceae bacterium]
MDRRTFVKSAALIAGTIASSLNLRGGSLPKTLLVVSGWQYANIGDIAHTPGLLQLLHTYLPNQVKIILWPNHHNLAEEAMLKKNFPHLTIVNGKIEDGQIDSDEVKEALAKADFLLHGSGPMLVGHAKVAYWQKNVKKPYGVLGITISSVSDYLKDIFQGADFVFTRETKSLKNLKDNKVNNPLIGFAPDATFAMNLQDNPKAFAFMQKNDLKPDKFICAIPRLRQTPYYKIYEHMDWSQEKINEVNQLNDSKKEEDHAKLREAMITYVRQTGNKVVVCPEMTYQLEIMDELLIDPLPVDVKKNVVKKDTYWLPDEAGSLYQQAMAVLSFECHSPIIAAVNQTPCFYLRQPEDTIKGQMWYDIGLNDWVFEIEETSGDQITAQLMKVYEQPGWAAGYLATAMEKSKFQYENNFDRIEKLWLI